MIDDDLIAQHPDLMPELADQLKMHREIANERDQNRSARDTSQEVADETLFVSAANEPNAIDVGAQLGNYKLLQLIGQGGMGTVWLAVQEHPIRRRVAIKVIKGGLDSADVMRRFEAERQALAMMDHQNIAKVIDAGMSKDGTPFFSMELVQGCTSHRILRQQQIDSYRTIGTVCSDMRRDSACTPEGHHPPRPKTIQCARDCCRREANTKGYRFWLGEGTSASDKIDRQDDSHGIWAAIGNAAIHESRTGRDDSVRC